MSLLAQDERLTRRVGAVTMLLLSAAIVFFVFVYHRIDWGGRVRVRVYFLTTGGLVEGAPFVVAGQPVGEIESIALSPRGAASPLGGEEGVAVTVAIDEDMAAKIGRGGDVFVTSRGALSSRYLEIGPAPGPGPSLRDGDELRGRDPPSLDRVLQRTWTNLTIAKRFADEVRPDAQALGAEIDNLRATLMTIAPEILLRDDFDQLVEEARKTYAALGGEQGIERIRGLRTHADTVVGQARASIAKLRTSADALSASVGVLKTRVDSKGVEAFDRIETAIARVRAAADKIDPLLAQVAAIEQHIARGEGSLLKLARDPEFPEDAKELGRILKRQPWKILDRPPK